MKQAIAFAHYKGEELLGYRADTIGTLSMRHPKIYHYSKEQVNIVLSNIRYTLGEKKRTIASTLLGVGADPVMCEALEKAENKIYDDAQDARAFEVRVVKCPDYSKEFNVSKAEYVHTWEYPVEEIIEWLAHPEDHETIETHQFSMMGPLPVQ